MVASRGSSPVLHEREEAQEAALRKRTRLDLAASDDDTPEVLDPNSRFVPDSEDVNYLMTKYEILLEFMRVDITKVSPNTEMSTKYDKGLPSTSWFRPDLPTCGKGKNAHSRPLTKLEEILIDKFYDRMADDAVSQLRFSKAASTIKNCIPLMLSYVRFCGLMQYTDFDVEGTRIMKFFEWYLDPNFYSTHKNITSSSIQSSTISALEFLYRIQMFPNETSEDVFPGKDKLQDFFKNRQLRRKTLGGYAYADKTKTTDADGDRLSIKELVKIYETCWLDTAKNNSEDEIRLNFMTLVDIKLGFSHLLRGDKKRGLNWSDIFTMFRDCNYGELPLFVTTNFGSNPNSKIQTGVAVASARHKNVFLCPFTIFGFWFYYEFGQNDYCPFDFDKNSAWYDIKVMTNKNKRGTSAQLSANIEGSLTTRALAKVGRTCWKKVTHLGRLVGAMIAGDFDVSENAIRRQGKWTERDTMLDVYMSKFPLEFIHFNAGFQEKERYYITRAGVTPPIELQKQLFPYIEEEEMKINALNANLPAGESKNLTVPRFLAFLKYLRITMLQDLVIMNESCETYFADCDLTKHPLYEGFRVELLDHVQKANSKVNLSAVIQNQCPEMFYEMGAIKTSIFNLSEQFEDLSDGLTAAVRERGASIDMLNERVDSLYGSMESLHGRVESLYGRVESLFYFMETLFPNHRPILPIHQPVIRLPKMHQPNVRQGNAHVAHELMAESEGIIAQSKSSLLNFDFTNYEFKPVVTFVGLYRQWYLDKPSVTMAKASTTWKVHRNPGAKTSYYRKKRGVRYVDEHADAFLQNLNDHDRSQLSTPESIRLAFCRFLDDYILKNSDLTYPRFINSLEKAYRNADELDKVNSLVFNYMEMIGTKKI